ncbi:MAG: oligosaccharide flippase family protein [Rhodopseudomonas sp.]|uniref:lipopolysaccharide biosynthesis protein n=1 Tax=Rhodopseudomonas sp. TaxID=1078 RepID=UPI0039E61525
MSFLAAARGHFAGRVLLFLGATALQALLAVAILPLTTLKLTAADFGYFALLMSLTAFANAMGDGGGALALPAHYGAQPASERRRMMASFFVVSLGLSTALAALFVAAWPLAEPYLIGADAGGYSRLTEVLAATIIPLRSVTTLATTVFSVSGRGNAIAAQIAAQAIGTFAGTLVCLFGLDLGPTSLFAGAVIGQLASLAIAGLALGVQPWTRPSAHWLAVVWRHAPTAAFTGVTDGLRGVGENAVIAGNVGVASLGFYNHARLYYGLQMNLTNAVAHNLWSVSLAEARDAESGFRRTGEVWMLVHILISLFGIGFALFGGDFVALLTNDRLTAAAPLVPWLAVLLLIHVSGRAQNALVYAEGAGPAVSRVRAGLSLLALAVLPVLVGKAFGYGLSLGISGVIAVLIVEAVTFRLYLRWKTTTFGRRIEFQDRWVVGGIVLTIAVWLLNAEASVSVALRGVVFAVMVLGILALERARFADLLRMLRL